jgi:hypothetical protein
MDILQLAQLGGVGIGFLSVYAFWKIISNHIEHNTKAIENLAIVLSNLKEFLEHSKTTNGHQPKVDKIEQIVL